MSFIFPSLPIFPETFATLVKVPAVSKKSMKNRVNITVTIEAESAAPKSNANKCVIGGGAEATPLNFAKPVTQAIILKAMIPMTVSYTHLTLPTILLV